MAPAYVEEPKAFRVLLSGGTASGALAQLLRIREVSPDRQRLDRRETSASSGTDELLGGVAGAGRGGRRVLHRGTDRSSRPRPRARSLFTRFYDAVVRSKDDPPAQVFVLGFDSEPIRAEKSLYDLATWTRDPARAGRVAT